MEQMVSEKQITLRSNSTGPGGPGFGIVLTSVSSIFLNFFYMQFLCLLLK